MQAYFKKIVNILFGRLARNVYFWLIFFLNFYTTGTAVAFPYSSYLFFCLALVSLIIYSSMIYINNLWLLPVFFKKKRYKSYFIGVGVLIIMYAFIITYYNYWFDKHFPLAKFNDIALLSLGSNDLHKDVTENSFAFFDIVIWSIIPMTFFIFVFSMGWFMNDYFVQQKRLDDAIKEKLESELALIKQQVSPHFLFNTLNNLYGLSLIKSDHLPELLLKLSNILRYLIYESGSSLIQFEKEKEVVESYINLELLRLTHVENLRFAITADKNYQIPPLLWLPVLENIFKHGTRQINNDVDVNFTFEIYNNCLKIHSRNLFQRSILKKEEVGGFGLENLKRRLSIIYPNRFILKETIVDNVYEIFININLYD